MRKWQFSPFLRARANGWSGTSGDSPVLVSGFVGEQVVLPCTYSGNVSVSDLQIIWGTLKYELLHKFVNGNDALREQNARFRNRTNLFKDQLEKGNWSVLISDLRETDQDEYECQIYSRMGDHFRWKEVVSIQLSVTVGPTQGPNETLEADHGKQLNRTQDPGLSTGASAGLQIGILAAVVFAVVGIVFCIIRQRKRWNCIQNQHSSEQNQASNCDPLTEVPGSGEAQSRVPTAPEHQDGAAREQNLLGNRSVQH
ncbi:uncharacterized protein LOC125448525 isoform X2 [Stegostoma tigrinum]|uniref:uncharacterized protein LOC125448525 isoform X2 n=1 Tax=Stegostoma tigrinum TaxID=3053191 RepID=UPI0028701AED|nr:uncharacterized protein LOC125448525 isoform X2 [Stegostoma tigrinum]